MLPLLTLIQIAVSVSPLAEFPTYSSMIESYNQPFVASRFNRVMDT